MSKAVGALLLVGVGVAIAVWWPRVREEFLPRLAGQDASSWEDSGSSGVLA